MNERLRQLARQSGLIQYDTDGKMVDVEKFAELIVRECALLCSDPVEVLQHWGIDTKSE